MALLPIPAAQAGETLRTQFTIPSYPAGNNGVVYTVPEGKNFTGYFWMNSPNSASFDVIKLNGQDIVVGYNTTYGTWYAFPIYLSAGDVVKNVGQEYFNLTGYEE